MNPLQMRLASLRRRMRIVISFRGVCWLATLLLLASAGVGWLDWRVHLPAFIRALLLCGALAGLVAVLYRHLIVPLWGRTDDLSLALRVEQFYPELNDSLASAVQFLALSPRSVQVG